MRKVACRSRERAHVCILSCFRPFYPSASVFNLCVDRAIEKRVDHLFEENQRMTKEITHLRRFCESLQTQLRMVQAEAMTESRPPVTSPTLSEEGGEGEGEGGGRVKKF